MAIDSKYGRVTLLPKLLAYYHLFCLKAGSPRRHLDLILATRDKVLAWQSANASKVPDSENSHTWMK